LDWSVHREREHRPVCDQHLGDVERFLRVLLVVKLFQDNLAPVDSALLVDELQVREGAFDILAVGSGEHARERSHLANYDFVLGDPRFRGVSQASQKHARRVCGAHENLLKLLLYRFHTLFPSGFPPFHHRCESAVASRLNRCNRCCAGGREIILVTLSANLLKTRFEIEPNLVARLGAK
jgi:hypothetical protein